MSVPRILLKNGKRSKEELSSSQARHQGEVSAFIDTNTSVEIPCCDDRTVSSQSQDSNTIDDGEEPCNGLTTNQYTGSSANNMMSHDTAFHSTVVHDIGSLKATVDNLKQEVQELRSKVV